MDPTETVNISESSDIYFDYAQREEDTREVIVESLAQTPSMPETQDEAPGGSGVQNARKRKIEKTTTDSDGESESYAVQQKKTKDDIPSKSLGIRK